MIKKLHISSVVITLLFVASGLTSSYAQMSKMDIQSAVDRAYDNNKNVKEGKNADYIPALAEVNSNYFGICLVTVDGQVFTKGDVDPRFSIQSISKVFALAKVIEEQGAQAIQDKVGVDATGDVFRSEERR